MRTILILALAALASSAAASGPSGMSAGELAMQTPPDPFPTVYTPNAEYQDFSGRQWRQDYIRRLNQLCRSPSSEDKRLCNEAWAAINTAYAELQKRKTRADR